jgi:hypothetical protein
LTFTPTVNNTREFFEIIVNNSVQWANEGWGGHVNDGAFIYVNPLLSLKDATTSLQPLINYVQSLNGSVVVETSPTWLSFFTKYVIPRSAVCVSQL